MGKRKGRQSETLIPSNAAQEDEFRDQRSDDSEEDDKSGFFACYLLTSLCPRYKGHTYIGFTVNPRRRIRQHNGELCSGAWRTKKKRPWEMVLCIYGFPTNVAALQFEWAWQHPVESLAVRKAAVGFKSLGGLAMKIKLAYTMLTLPTWNKLNLNVNFFSSKYTKHYAGCPTLPTHMRVHIRSMDELPCYTGGYKEDEDDMFTCEDDLLDDVEEPEKPFEDVMVPVLCPANHQNNEKLQETEALCDLDDKNDEHLSNKYLWDDDKEPETIYGLSPADHQNGENEQLFNKHLWDDDKEPETIHGLVPTDHQNGENEAIFVSDDENDERMLCTERKMRGGSSNEVEVVDLFTPLPEYRIRSRRKKRGVSVVCPEIIDLTESPICV